MKSLGESEWHTIVVQFPHSIFPVSLLCSGFSIVDSGGLDRSFCGWVRDLVLLSSRLS